MRPICLPYFLCIADGKREEYLKQVQEALNLLAGYRDTMKEESTQRSLLIADLRKELAEQEAQQSQLDVVKGNISALEDQFLASKALLQE